MGLDDLLYLLIINEGKRDYDDLSLIARQWLTAERGDYTPAQMREWFTEQILRILEWADLMEKETMADTKRELA